MKAKKIMSIILACGMSIALLAGCGQETDAKPGESPVSKESSSEGSSAVMESVSESVTDASKKITFPLEEPVTLTAYVCTANEYLLEDSLTMKVMEERTNVHWEFVYVPSTEHAEKKGLILNSGDYPDVFLKGGLSADELNEYGSQGVLIPLDDMLEEYAPNFTALMNELETWGTVTSADGHIYSLAQASGLEYVNPVMFINEKWLENLGLKHPTTMDEFYEVLKAFKEKDADGDGDPNNEIPLIASNTICQIDAITPYVGINYEGWNSNIAVDYENGGMYFWPASETWKDTLSVLSKWYEEGLIYNDTFNINLEQERALGKSGEAIGCFFDWNVTEMFGDLDHKVDYAIVMPFEGNKFTSTSGVKTGAFSITDKCEYPEIALAWIDYFYSDEGSILAGMGVEGITYEVDENGKWNWKTDGEYGETPKNSATIWQGGGVPLPRYWSDFERFEKYVDPENIASVKSAEANAKINEGYRQEIPWKALGFTEEEAERKATIAADIDPYWQQYRAQVICGQLDLEATWDEYIAKLQKMGLDEYEEIHNNAYDRIK